MDEATNQVTKLRRTLDFNILMRRRWWRIIPVAFIMYTIAYVDRTNISLCLPAMGRALGKNPVAAGSVAGVFFWGYLVLQIPGGHLARSWGAKRIVSVLLVGWGSCAIAVGFVSTWHEAWVARLFLGVAEGGVFPATLVLLSNWFGHGERARANCYWMLCQPAAIVIASPLSGCILGHWGWRMVFVVEGCLPFLWLVVWILRIDDSPETAKWISHEERGFVAEALHSGRTQAVTAQSKIMIRLVFDPRVYIMATVAVFVNCAAYGLLFWMPSAFLLAKRLSALSVSILFTLPYVSAGLMMVLNSRDSDSSGDRRLHVMAPLFLSGLCLFAAVFIGRISFLSYVVLLCAAVAGPYAALGPFWAIPTESLSEESSGAAIGLINSIGNLGGYFGPLVVGELSERTGDFGTAFVVLSLCLLAGAMLALALAPVVRIEPIAG